MISMATHNSVHTAAVTAVYAGCLRSFAAAHGRAHAMLWNLDVCSSLISGRVTIYLPCQLSANSGTHAPHQTTALFDHFVGPSEKTVEQHHHHLER